MRQAGGDRRSLRTAAAVFLLAACTRPSEPAERPPVGPRLPGSLIAFSADLDGGWDFYEGNADIFVMGADGGPRRNLTRHPANDFSPSWSPDGTRIAFRTDRDGNHEIYVMEADGSDPVNLTGTPDAEERSPAWSPEGSRIAFASNRDGEYDIYVMDADGSNVTRLHGPGLDEYPTWSPDGRWIAFTSYCLNCAAADLYVMRADGTGRRALGTSAGWPEWSPDGRHIAFDTTLAGTVGVHLIEPRRGAKARFIVAGLQAGWSPHGRQIAYAVHEGALLPERNDLTADLFIASADGSRRRQLTDTPEVFEFEPTWQPTGTSAFVSVDPVTMERRYAAGAALFDYEATAPLGVRQTHPPLTMDDYTVHDIAYGSPEGGSVPATVLVPSRPGPHPGVILQHGLPGTRTDMRPLASRLAELGAVAIMIDAPFARRSNSIRPEGPITLTQRDRREQIQLIVDLRRAVDVLHRRFEVDPARIGYLGVSYGGAMGALLAGVEPRIRTSVLVVGDGGLVTHFTGPDDTDGPFWDLSRSERTTWIHAMEPIEPLYFVGQASGSVFFQSARLDDLVPPADARWYHRAGDEPSDVRWYDAGHLLPPAAECDQLRWLDRELDLPGDPGAAGC